MFNTTLNRDEPKAETVLVRGIFDLGKDGPVKASLKLEYADFETLGQARENFSPRGTFSASPFFSTVETVRDGRSQNGGLNSKTNVFNSALNLDIEAGSHIVTLTSGYVHYSSKEKLDVDFTALAILDDTNQGETYDQLSQEIRVTSPGDGPFKYIVGGYYQTSKLSARDDVIFGDFLKTVPAPFTAFRLLGDSRSVRRFRQTSTLWSGFAQATYELTDALSITAGVRINHEAKSGSRNLVIVAGPTNLFPIANVRATWRALRVVEHDISGNISENSTTPMANIQYHLTPDLMVYASYAKGVKAGGFDIRSNSLPTTPSFPGAFIFRPEKADNYEGGVKFQNRSLSLSLSYYNTKYKDLQTSTFDGGIGFNVNNASAAKVQGSPAETDPVTMGWMQGNPPPPEKRIQFQDGSFYQFPKTRWSFAHYRELMPTARVSRGSGAVARLPVALRRDLDTFTFTPIGRTDKMSWAAAFEAVYGDAVLILHKGQIVYERYNGVMNGNQPHIAFSVTKSFFGTLGEILIAEGRLDETAPVSRYIPELAQSGFGDATVRQVLDMTTGLAYSEDYTDPKADIAKFAVAVGMGPAPPGYDGPKAAYDYLLTVPKKGAHGEGFTYKSVNTEVLGWLIARVTGKRPQEYLSERIWSQLGAEQDSNITVDSAGSPFTAGGLSLTLRDMARFGETMRLGGRFNGRQIIPASVVAKICTGASKEDFAKAGYKTLPGWSYKSQWWITHNAHGAFSARGIHGQAIYIDPKAEMVIVRFASNPKASNVNFDDVSLPAYHAIAEKLIRAK